MSIVTRHELTERVHGEVRHVATIIEPSVRQPLSHDIASHEPPKQGYIIEIETGDSSLMHAIVETVVAHTEEIVRRAEADVAEVTH